MDFIRTRRSALIIAAALAPLAAAQAQTPGGCAPAGAAAVNVGTVAEIAPGAARTYTVQLSAGQGVIVDLMNSAPKPQTNDEHDHDHGENDGQPPVRHLKICDASGKLLAPQPGEVFAKGGSITSTDDGERLRFMADAAGAYVIAVAADAQPRELLVRKRSGGGAQSPVIAATLGAPQKGIVSSNAPMVFSFTGAAGQWVELKATSERDTLLRLAAPDRQGGYSVVAENDDSDGLNPMLRRRLPMAGTYYVQVDSFSDEPGEFDLALNKIAPPPPPPPPTPLRAGATVSGKLADGDDVKLYTLPLAAGHTYRLEVTASYDAVVAIGVPNPVESDDSGRRGGADFAEIKSQDSGTSGIERLNFTARSNGQVLVQVRSFGIDDSDGAFTLAVTDLGG